VAKKLYYKIGEACKELDIQPYVLRYWETEFQALSPNKSKSGQRVYSAEDLELIRRIKELLYKEGYTIAGAKKKLDGDVGRKPDAVKVAEPDRLGIEDGEEEKSPKLLVKDAAPAARKVTKATKKAASTLSVANVKKLQKGIRSALQEAKEILAILDSHPGSG